MMDWITILIGAVALWALLRSGRAGALLAGGVLLVLGGLWAARRVDLYWAELPAITAALAGVGVGAAVMLGRQPAGAALFRGLAGLLVMFALSGTAYTLLHLLQHGSVPPDIQPLLTWLGYVVGHAWSRVHDAVAGLSAIRPAVSSLL